VLVLPPWDFLIILDRIVFNEQDLAIIPSSTKTVITCFLSPESIPIIILRASGSVLILGHNDCFNLEHDFIIAGKK